MTKEQLQLTVLLICILLLVSLVFVGAALCQFVGGWLGVPCFFFALVVFVLLGCDIHVAAAKAWGAEDEK